MVYKIKKVSECAIYRDGGSLSIGFVDDGNIHYELCFNIKYSDEYMVYYQYPEVIRTCQSKKKLITHHVDGYLSWDDAASLLRQLEPFWGSLAKKGTDHDYFHRMIAVANHPFHCCPFK